MAHDELLEEGADESDDAEFSEEDIVKNKDCDDDDTDVFSDDQDSGPGDTMLSAAASSQVGSPMLPIMCEPYASQSSFRRGASSATIPGSQTSES